MAYSAADGLSLENVADRVKAFRSAFNLSQGDLGKLVGKTRATVIRWEKEGPGENTALVVLAMTQLYQRLKANSPEVSESSSEDAEEVPA